MFSSSGVYSRIINESTFMSPPCQFYNTGFIHYFIGASSFTSTVNAKDVPLSANFIHDVNIERKCQLVAAWTNRKARIIPSSPWRSPMQAFMRKYCSTTAQWSLIYIVISIHRVLTCLGSIACMGKSSWLVFKFVSMCYRILKSWKTLAAKAVMADAKRTRF